MAKLAGLPSGEKAATRRDIDMVVVGKAEFASNGRPTTVSPLGSLRLRIRGTQRNGQILRIASPRATIGGAPTCTVRLGAPGVRPLQCLILRKARDVIVRSLAGHNTLNGGPFHEASLRPGDILGLGTIAFEMLPYDDQRAADRRLPPALVREAEALSPACADSSPVSASPDEEVFSRIERLERQLADFEHRCGDAIAGPPANPTEDSTRYSIVEQLTQQVVEERADRAHEREQWLNDAQQHASELAESQTQLAELQRQLADQRITLARQEKEWQHAQAELIQLQSTIEHLSLKLDKERTQQQQQQSHRQSEQAAWHAALQAKDQQLAEWERLTAEEQARVQSQRAELEATIQAQQEARAAWERQAASQTTFCEECEARLEQQMQMLAELQQKCANLETALAQKSELEHRAVQSAESACVAREAERVKHQRERQDWDAERKWLTEDLAARTRAVAQQQQTLQQAEEQTAEERQVWEQERCRLLDEISELKNRLSCRSEHATAPFDGTSAIELAAGPADVQEPVPEQWPDHDRACLVVPEHDSEPEENLEASPQEDCTDDSKDRTAPSVAAPVSAAEAIARLGQAGLWREEDDTGETGITPETAVQVDSLRPPLAGLSSAVDSLAGHSRTSEQRLGITSRDGGEESIEDYMNRLLHRLRGSESSPLPASPALHPEMPRSPITEASWPEEPACERHTELQEFLPRSQAPELAANLAAMRSLANDTTRTAIVAHVRRDLSSRAKGRVLAASLLFVAAAVGVFVGRHDRAVAGTLLTAMGMTVIYLGWQALSFRKHLLKSVVLEAPEPTSARS